MHLTKAQIAALPHIYKINLINSISGYKSANLIGSKSTKGVENVAVFSSVVHYGSNPPILGFVLRPTTVARNTYDNIKATKVYTINAVPYSLVGEAHHSAAKYDFEVSEFDKTELIAEYKETFYAPYVQQSSIKIGLKYLEEYAIKANGTILVLGEVQYLYIDDGLIAEDGFVDLIQADIAAINGLDTYVKPNEKKRFEYQHPNR